MAFQRPVVAAVIMVLTLVVPGIAPAGEVLLGFGSTYPSADGGSSVHRGVDVAAAAGEDAEAPVAGEVTFAGAVPSRAGGTVHAVSVRCGDDILTVMPLDSTEVDVGEVVIVGQALGSIAPAGDPSVPEAHLHVSLRREGVYLDPLPYMAGFSADAGSVVDPLSETASRPPSAEPEAGLTHMPHAAEVFEPARCQPSSPAEPALGDAPAATITHPDPIRTASPVPAAPVEISEGVSLGGIAPRVPADSGTLPDSTRIWRRAAEDLPSIAASPAGISSVVAALLAVFVLLTRRAVERRIMSNPPVSDRFGSMLQHLRAGDTICGLTSCSGLLPSQSRGRLAQRR